MEEVFDLFMDQTENQIEYDRSSIKLRKYSPMKMRSELPMKMEDLHANTAIKHSVN